MRLNIILANAAAQQLFGRSADQMRGRPLAEIAGEKRQAILDRLLRRTLRDGQVREFEVRYSAPDGQQRVLLAIISPLTDGNGRATGVAAWTRDITRRVELADKLTAAERLAGLGTLASGVAHHFNNILGGVATFVDFALTTNDPAAGKRALEMTAEATSRVAKVTQSLLTFAEQDSRRKDLADLTEVVLTFAHLVERPLRERNIKLNLDLNSVPIVAIEANRMHQVLGNLLTNAEEAMPKGGTITIGVWADESGVEISFTDTGRGIRPEHLPHIFEPFFTTKGLLAGGDGGNPGLGLSVVHGLVTEMRGTITAISPAIADGSDLSVAASQVTADGTAEVDPQSTAHTAATASAMSHSKLLPPGGGARFIIRLPLSEEA